MILNYGFGTMTATTMLLLECLIELGICILYCSIQITNYADTKPMTFMNHSYINMTYIDIIQ